MAIIGCRDRRTERFLAGARVKELQAFAEAANKALTKLQAAMVLADLRSPPSNRFEALEAQKGVYSIRINRQYRVCFTWKPHATVAPGTDALQAAGDADDVEISNHYE
jgi:proteic killer suppression protein